ncbi:hypothetical protein, partial [Pseudomonas syringae]|uniref:hypothetical protein n=1 Tax=Pseudomonas syringae TaxID=317 RepID=UPI001FED9017
VLLFSVWLRTTCEASDSEKLSTSKKSVSYASVRVVLVMSEPVRIVFIRLLRVFIFVVQGI